MPLSSDDAGTQGGGDDRDILGVHAALKFRGEEDVGRFADGVTGELVADSWRDTGVSEVGGVRKGELRHHECVTGRGDLRGKVVSGGLMSGTDLCTVTTRTSEFFALAVAFRIGSNSTVNRKCPT